MHYAVVDNGVVRTIAVWDGKTEWDPSPGVAIKVTGTVGIGWTYDGKTFSPPPLPPVDEETVIKGNQQQKVNLMAEATRRISVLTDATDPDIMGDDIDPADADRLKAWKLYRVQLSRVTDMLDPEWPSRPTE